MTTRRNILAAAAALPFIVAAQAATAHTRIVLLGQALIQHDLRQVPWNDRDGFARLFKDADAVFTDLETTIIGPNGGAVTRDPALLHRADAAVLDCLSTLHVNLFATANNHAFDVGTGGIIDTMAALDARGLTYAGTGYDLAAAEAPAFLSTPHGEIALVAMASGKIRTGGAATMDRAGVNELRLSAPGVLDRDDVGRFLDAVSTAAKQTRFVLAYDHNHYWEPDIADVPAWQVDLAHRCIDAGAIAFVGHGAPVLQGIEVYRGRPAFYGLGNFIYQSPSPTDPYGPATWRSVIADCQFGVHGFEARLLPITLNRAGVGGPADLVTKGMPSLAKDSDAIDILQALAQRSQRFGTRWNTSSGIAKLAGTFS